MNPEPKAEADAVGGRDDIDSTEGVAVGIEVIPCRKDKQRRCCVGADNVVTGDWRLVGVAVGEDADDDAGLSDVAVGVGDEIVECDGRC